MSKKSSIHMCLIFLKCIIKSLQSTITSEFVITAYFLCVHVRESCGAISPCVTYFHAVKHTHVQAIWLVYTAQFGQMTIS